MLGAGIGIDNHAANRIPHLASLRPHPVHRAAPCLLTRDMDLPIMGRSREMERIDEIGEAARLTRVSAKMIRHYGSIGLVLPPTGATAITATMAAPTCTGWASSAARDLGFSIEEIRDLLRLWGDTERSEPRRQGADHPRTSPSSKEDAALEEMRATLAHLVHCCEGDHRPVPDHREPRGAAAPFAALNGSCA